MFKYQSKFLIHIYLAALLLGMITGCTKEKCVVCPPDQPPAEKEYYFLYSGGYYNWIYIYSTKTSQIVDSAKYPVGFFDARFSKDGKYAYYTAQRPRIGDPPVTWIEEFSTRDTISLLDGIGGYRVSVSSDERYLLISGTTKLALLEIPSLAIVYQREHGNAWAHGAIHPSRNVAYVGNNALDSLLIIDFRTSAIRDSTVPLFRENGTPTAALSVAVTTDGRTMIISRGIRVQLRDAETLQLLHEYYPGRNTPYLHPDGQRVFFLEWREVEYGKPAELWELNLRTLLMTRVLNGQDFSAYSPYFALTPTDMDFTPDGKYAFIISGQSDQSTGSGVILKLDCDTYKIVDAIYPPLGGSDLIRINPMELKAGE